MDERLRSCLAARWRGHTDVCREFGICADGYKSISAIRSLAWRR